MNTGTKERITMLLRPLSKNVLKQAELLIEEFEDENAIEKRHFTMAQTRTFRKRYVIRLLEENILDERDAELVLASCGLLAGYDGIASLEKRRKKYEDAVTGIDCSNSSEATKEASWRSYQKEKKIYEQMLGTLDSKIDKETGRLDFADTVIAELLDEFGGTIPEKLPLPEPRFTKDAIMRENAFLIKTEFPFNNLMVRNNHFTGREELLGTIADGFYNKKMGIQLLSGMPGVGKTQMALEFAHQNTGRYSIIWWLNAEDEASLRVACKSFLDSRKEPYDHDNVSLEFRNFFNNQTAHWLLIYDNAELFSREQREIFSSYLPAERRAGNILITTRTCTDFYGISPIHVDVFTQEEAVKYIRSVVGKSSAKGDKYLAKRLGYLPLPISYAAAYIKQTPQFNCTGYLKELSRKGIRIFEDSDNICLDYYKKTVRATFLISIEKYKKQAEQGDSFMAGVVQFIFSCAYFPSSFIDLEMIAIFCHSLYPEFNQIMKDPFSLRKMVQILIASSLFYNVTISDSDPVHDGLILGIHRLLQEVLVAELHPVFPEKLDYFYSVYPNTIHIPLKLPNDILGRPWKIDRNDVFSILPIITQKYIILTLLGPNPIAECIFIVNNIQLFFRSFQKKSNPPIDADYLIGTGFLESEDDFPDFVSSLPSRVSRLLYFYYLIWEILIETVLPSCGNLVGIKDLGRYTEKQVGWIVDLFASYFFCRALPPGIKQEDIDSSNANLRPLLQDMITCMGVHLFRDIIMSDKNEQFAFFRNEGIGSFPDTENLMNDKNELFAFLRDRGIDPFSVLEEPT